MPGAMVWKAVTEALTRGFDVLHPTARLAALIGAVLGVAIEWANLRTKGKFPVSAMGLGLAFVLHFTDSLAMGIGAFVFWLCERKLREGSKGHKIFVLIILENIVFAGK